MNRISLTMIFIIWTIMPSLMRKPQRNQGLRLKWFRKCKVHIRTMLEPLKCFLKGVQSLISITITIPTHKQNLNSIINRKSMLNKLNINNHPNLRTMIKTQIKVYITGIVCLLRRDTVPFAIKIKSYALNIVESAIDVQHCMIIIVHGPAIALGNGIDVCFIGFYFSKSKKSYTL